MPHKTEPQAQMHRLCCTPGAFAPHLCVEERICGQICSEAPPSLAVAVLPRRRRPSSLLNSILPGAMEGSHPVIEQTSRIMAMSRWGDSGTKVCLLPWSPPLPTHPYGPPHWFPRPRLARFARFPLVGAQPRPVYIIFTIHWIPGTFEWELSSARGKCRPRIAQAGISPAYLIPAA
ncbi:hypothetical protein FA13DRAFT_1713545 [Coprinellus micaceus]|uniref:Uncharacterized protein n=1 Tax=Coprinellus micaceus TaxID=71717 RepID=A0A4Y7SY35_COPMI|nr:hypothetical protein FA13DRAFT_1713545 [Coprinellus micaceus]